MRFEFLLQFGFDQGFGIERDTWRNQYGYGVFFNIKVGFFKLEFSIDRLYVS